MDKWINKPHHAWSTVLFTCQREWKPIHAAAWMFCKVWIMSYDSHTSSNDSSLTEWAFSKQRKQTAHSRQKQEVDSEASSCQSSQHPSEKTKEVWLRVSKGHQWIGAHNILQSSLGRQQSCWSSGLRVLDTAEKSLHGWVSVANGYLPAVLKSVILLSRCVAVLSLYLDKGPWRTL